MKPQRGKTPKKKYGFSGVTVTEPVEVYCRIKPINDPDKICLKNIGENQVQLIQPLHSICDKICPSTCYKICPSTCYKICPSTCYKICPSTCYKICPSTLALAFGHPPARFHDAIHMRMRWSKVALKSGLFIAMEALGGTFSVAKFTSPEPLIWTPPSFAITSTPSRRSSPGKVWCTINTSTVTGRMFLIFNSIVSTPRLVRVFPSAVTICASLALHERYADLHLRPSTSSLITGSASMLYLPGEETGAGVFFPDSFSRAL
ncbi:unnamed protein product [Acanthosepion pharaonis]|uniref:Uncharacterized protein n=1 Tax=Acanthosepion pharaonis TaxID=158019 RepID=A0A812D986_ACAPH|nr:unnamed protein product [Sepia pharaonis]